MVTSADAGYARAFPVDGLVRRWRSITVWALVGLLVGSAALFLLPKVYSSTVSVIIEPSLGNPYSPTDAGQSLDNLITEAAVANSTPVADSVRKSVAPGSSTSDLRAACAVDRVPNSQILEISCSDANRDRARRIAAGFAKAFLAYRGNVSESATKTQLDSLTSDIAETNTALNDAVRKLPSVPPSSAERQSLISKIQTATATLTTLNTQANEIRYSQSDPGRVLSPASKPRGGFSLKRLAYPFVGLVLAGMVGLLVAARNALRDDKVHTASDLDVIGPPVLAPPETLRSAHAAMDDDAAAIVSAAFRGRVGPDRTAVVLTSIGPGVNTVRGALRIVEALRSDSLDAALVELHAVVPVHEAALVTAGGSDDSPGELVTGPGTGAVDAVLASDEHDTDATVYKITRQRLERQAFRDFLDRLGARHELVVIAGAVLSEPLTLDAVEAVGDTMLVVPMGRFNEQEVRSAVDQVRLFHGRVIALVAS